MKQETKQLKILIDARLASAFKAACKGSGVSMAKDLAAYMEARVGASGTTAPQVPKPAQAASRKGRRTALRGIVQALETVRDAEGAYAGRIPENLKSGPAYEDAEAAVCAMDEAIALLEEAYR